jgi:hypothetical protein
MFQTTYRSSSGDQKLYFHPLVLHTSVDAGRCHRPSTKDYKKPEAANTVFELLMMSDVSFETVEQSETLE